MGLANCMSLSGGRSQTVAIKALKKLIGYSITFKLIFHPYDAPDALDFPSRAEYD